MSLLFTFLVRTMRNITDTAFETVGIILETIRSGELTSLPLLGVSALRPGDLICLEAVDLVMPDGTRDYAYLKVVGIYDYRRRFEAISLPEWRLVTFELVESLSDIVVG